MPILAVRRWADLDAAEQARLLARSTAAIFEPGLMGSIEALFEGVKVEDVRTSKVHGKVKKQGRYQGKAPDWKKAWVRLAPGSKDIEFFEAS